MWLLRLKCLVRMVEAQAVMIFANGPRDERVAARKTLGLNLALRPERVAGAVTEVKHIAAAHETDGWALENASSRFPVG